MLDPSPLFENYVPTLYFFWLSQLGHTEEKQGVWNGVTPPSPSLRFPPNFPIFLGGGGAFLNKCYQKLSHFPLHYNHTWDLNCTNQILPNQVSLHFWLVNHYLASLQWWDKFWPGNKYLREQTVQKCENALIVSLFLFPKKKKKLVRCFVSEYKDSIKDQFYSWCLSLYMHGVVKASIALDLCSLLVPDFIKI